MCGVLYVKSTATISLDQHLQALAILQSRGPDFYRYQHSDKTFCAQTVLQITGNDEFYNRNSSDFFAFNGEIYNYRWFGSFSNDTELVYKAVKDAQFKKLTYFEGPWAWVYSDQDSVMYATDPQGERCLYRYQDNNILIVSSEVAAILAYVDSNPVTTDYTTKHWPTWKQTPWVGIERCEPGMLYNQNGAVTSIDSIFSWVHHSHIETLDQAWEEYVPLWSKVIADMTPTQNVGCTFSGGLDSSVIAASLPASTAYYTTNMLGKDPISQQCNSLLSEAQQPQLKMIAVTAEQWALAFTQVCQRTLMPVQSWSFVGQWIIAQHCQQQILFTGAGADELFGGYSVYQRLAYANTHSVSPYSSYGNDADAQQLWRQCLSAHQGQAEPATLLMDYVTQLGAVDLRGIDVCTSAHGIEPRSPFVHPKIIKFALSLPMSLRRGKPLIRKQFLSHWPNAVIEPKKGFTGHCNDSLPWMPFTVPDVPRDQQWQLMIKTGFTHFANQWLDRTIVQ